MIVKNISELPFNIQGLNPSNNTISLSRLGDQGAAVTPSKHLSRYYVSAGVENGLTFSADILNVDAAPETYAVIPGWTMKLGKTIGCTFMWSPNNDIFQAEFKIIE